jgi:glycosyltransferase involved in cell wall biosynthesis
VSSTRPDPRPACLVTGTVSDHRIEPFRRLAADEGLEVLAWRDPGPPVDGLTVRAVTQRRAVLAAASGRYRAVIAGLGGRVALPGSYLAARAARVPFVLWASLWAHPRTAAHAISYGPTLHLYRHADAIVTYGPHVSRYVAARGGGPIFEAPQAVSAAHFGAPVTAERREAARGRAGAGGSAFLALFVGRLVEEKGVRVLAEAWRRAEVGPGGVLAMAGAGPLAVRAPGVVPLGHVSRDDLPALYAAADVLVVPSIRTATFLEPWGLVVNEAMHQAVPIIASDAVGAVAGGLVADGRNGLVVSQRDPDALAGALWALASDPHLRRRLGQAGREDVARFDAAAWAGGMSRALAAVGAGRGR